MIIWHCYASLDFFKAKMNCVCRLGYFQLSFLGSGNVDWLDVSDCERVRHQTFNSFVINILLSSPVYPSCSFPTAPGFAHSIHQFNYLVNSAPWRGKDRHMDAKLPALFYQTTCAYLLWYFMWEHVSLKYTCIPYPKPILALLLRDFVILSMALHCSTSLV